MHALKRLVGSSALLLASPKHAWKESVNRGSFLRYEDTKECLNVVIFIHMKEYTFMTGELMAICLGQYGDAICDCCLRLLRKAIPFLADKQVRT